MKTFLQRNTKWFGQAILATAATVAFLLLGAAPRAKADNDNGCQHRIANADHKLHVAAEKHGWNSSQAAHARTQLREAREHCWSTYHKWWDEDDHRWHTEHDWNDHDHDDRH